jgi:hypothetical protein
VKKEELEHQDQFLKCSNEFNWKRISPPIGNKRTDEIDFEDFIQSSAKISLKDLIEFDLRERDLKK